MFLLVEKSDSNPNRRIIQDEFYEENEAYRECVRMNRSKLKDNDTFFIVENDELEPVGVAE